MRASTRAAKLIISPLNGHGQLAGHRLFCLLGRQIAEGLERAVSIIVALDVSEQRLSSFRLGCPLILLEVRTAKGKLYLFVGIDRYPPSSPSLSWSTRLTGA